MKKIYLHSLLTLIGFLCVSLEMNAQGFNNTYGTAANNEFKSVVKLSGGDYIASGTTYTGTSGDFYIARIDQSGNIVWQTTFGGSGNDVAYSSVLNTNGNIVVAGSSTSYSSNSTSDVLLVEINPSGVVQWSRNYGTTGNFNEVPNKINLTSGGLGIAGTSTVPGSTTPDILAFEVTNNGATVNWQRTYNSNGDLGYQLISSTASTYKYILVGGSNGTGNIGAYDQVILKLDATGTVVSTKNFGSTDNENAHSVIELPNNDLIIMGNIRALSGSAMDISLIKLTTSNTIDWAKSYGDHSTGNERAYNIIPTAAGGYAMIASTTGFGFVGGSNNDALIVTTDASGAMMGSKTYGGTGNELPYDIVQNADGSFTFASLSNSQGAGGNDASLVRTLTDLTAPGNCSPSSVNAYTIAPTSGTISFTSSPITFVVANVTNTASTVSFVKNVVPAFSVSTVSQVCVNTPAAFSISKPGVTMVWANTGTATTQVNNATNYTITYAQAGNYTVSGTYGSCSFSQPLAVTSTPVSFVGLNSSYKQYSPSLNLTASPSGGTFTINGNPATTFQFHTAGTYNVQYTYVDANSCVNTTSKSVTVNPVPSFDCPGVTLSFDNLLDFYCQGTAAFNLAASPAGGTFTINGTPATQFQPTTAGTYSVTYSYSEAGGCSDNITKTVTVGSFALTADDARICPGQDVLFTAIQCVAGTYNRFRFHVNGNPIGTFTSSNTSLISGLQGGDKVYVHAYNTGNTNEIISSEITIQAQAIAQTVSINIPTSNLFCNATDVDYPIQISPTISGGVLSGAGVSGTDFNPIGLAAGVHVLTYSAVVNGCTFTTTKNINVEQSPTVTITSSDADNKICLGDNVTFTANTAANRHLFLVNGVGRQGPANDNTFDISTLADGDVVSVVVDNGPNTCALESSSITTDVGVKPAVNFDWKNICGGNTTTGYEIQFTDLSTIAPPSTIVSWDWDADGNGTFDHTYAASNGPLHNYSIVGNFNAKLRVTTSEGCVVDLVKKVFTLDGFAVTKASPYEIDFATSDGGWDFDGVNPSWTYGTSTDFPSTGNIWVTKNSSNLHNVNEKSYLYSPCFNLSALDKPAIHLSIWSKTNINAGAILQISIDGGNTWMLVGAKGDGINWYDGSANGGVDDFPEANNSNDAWFGSYTDWKSARISLQEYVGEPAVRFRIAFGSNAASQTNPGFAVGKVKIVNRSRGALIEHFTNNNAMPCGIASNTVVEFMRDQRPSDIALIEYHTSHPSADIYSSYNFGDIGARDLYYGSRTPPRDVLNGLQHNDYSANCIPTANINLQTLDQVVLQDCYFNIEAQAIRGNGVFTIELVMEYTGATAYPNPITIQTVVVENEASGDPIMNYVARKLMPDATGTSLGNIIPGFTHHHNYGYYHLLNNPKLNVVIYIQDMHTKNVLQAIYVEGVVPTSTEASVLSDADFKVFPNPAQNQTNVTFGKTITTRMNWQLIDALGQVVNEGTVDSGVQGFNVDTSSQADGLYTLKVSQAQGDVITKKIVVTK